MEAEGVSDQIADNDYDSILAKLQEVAHNNINLPHVAHNKSREIFYGTNNLPHSLVYASYDVFMAGGYNNHIEGHLLRPVAKTTPDGRLIRKENGEFETIDELPKPPSISDDSYAVIMRELTGKKFPYRQSSAEYNHQQRNWIRGHLEIAESHLRPRFTLVQTNHLPTARMDDSGNIVTIPPKNVETYNPLNTYQMEELQQAAKLLGYEVPTNATTKHYLEVCDLLQHNGEKETFNSPHSKLVALAEKITSNPATASTSDIRMLQAAMSLYSQEYATKVDGALAPKRYTTNEQILSYDSHTLKQAGRFLSEGVTQTFALKSQPISTPVALGDPPGNHPTELPMPGNAVLAAAPTLY